MISTYAKDYFNLVILSIAKYQVGGRICDSNQKDAVDEVILRAAQDDKNCCYFFDAHWNGALFLQRFFMIRSFLCVFAIALTSLPTVAQQKLILTQSEIIFVSKQMGVPVDGKFKKFDAQMNFDPKKPESSKIGFTVDLASVDIGNSDTEKELTKPGWFNSLKVPQASFDSTSIKALGGGKFEVTGKLSIKGNTRDVTVPIALTQSGGTTTARGEFTLKRIEFKIGDGEWNDPSLVANEVIVKVKLALTGIAAL